MPAPPAVAVDSLSHSYRTPSGELPVLASLSFTVAPGEFLVVVGRSGSGKSTLLRVLAGLVRRPSGVVRVVGLSPADAAARKRLGVVFQQPALLPWRTVLSNVELAHELNSRGRSVPSRPGPAELVRRVGLAGFEDALPHTLSGGMQQRVALARSLALDPDVLLLDEPFAALDELTREEMRLELLRLWEADRKTVLMVTHSIVEAVTLADRVLVLSRAPARIVADLPIPLPRPRGPAITEQPEFLALCGRIRAALEAS